MWTARKNVEGSWIMKDDKLQRILEILIEDDKKYEIHELGPVFEILAKRLSKNIIDGQKSLMMALIAYCDETSNISKQELLRLISISWQSKKLFDKENSS